MGGRGDVDALSRGSSTVITHFGFVLMRAWGLTPSVLLTRNTKSEVRDCLCH